MTVQEHAKLILEHAAGVMERCGLRRGPRSRRDPQPGACLLDAVTLGSLKMHRSILEDMMTHEDATELAIATLINLVSPQQSLGSLGAWNDAEGRTVAEVVDLLRRAAATVATP